MRKLIYLVLILLIVSGPTFAKINLFGKGKDKDKEKDWEAIQVYETATFETKFAIVGKITIQGMHQNNLVEKFKKTALKYEGDAVLKYKAIACDKLPQFSTVIVGNLKLPCAEGVIVVLDDEGISEITEKTPIPVLQ